MKLDEFERIKSGGYVISKKLKDAVPIRILGYSQPSDLGVRFTKIVDNGLILAGSSANLRGTVNSIASGIYAGEVAAKAVQEEDFSAIRLRKYEELCDKCIPKGWQHKGFLDAVPFYQRSDEDIENLLREMIAKGVLFMFSEIPKVESYSQILSSSP
jgi:flavin-dependent dehydrogenase